MRLLHIIGNTFRAQGTLAPNETCPACGEHFACGASLRGCWCREVKLTDAARAELKQLYTGCLCRACLERVTERVNLQLPGERR
jgi:hypothetical protein